MSIDEFLKILNEESKWVKLSEEPKVFQFKKTKIIKKTIGGKERIYLRIFLIEPYTYKEKWLDTRSQSLARQIKELNLKEGDLFSIKKEGEKEKTRYKIFKSP